MMKSASIHLNDSQNQEKTVKMAMQSSCSCDISVVSPTEQSNGTSQVTYVTMVPRVGNETLRPLGVATGNALSVTRSEDTYEKKHHLLAGDSP